MMEDVAPQIDLAIAVAAEMLSRAKSARFKTATPESMTHDLERVIELTTELDDHAVTALRRIAR